ncbi:MAG TPA: metalloregulator ArsR/SmtB family transcription factor [Gammaproteobacteria bacterium]|nr:metalloregulator ArsR/SmtB family transcription factor [Gammaproteobacteria bacterium]
MVEYDPAPAPPVVDLRQAALDRVFAALSDRTRRTIVHLLAERERTVTEIAAPFDMSLAAVSKHLAVLERAGLVRRRRDGRTHYCSLRPESLTDALDWISIYRRFWRDRLDALAEAVSPPKKTTRES